MTAGSRNDGLFKFGNTVTYPDGLGYPVGAVDPESGAPWEGQEDQWDLGGQGGPDSQEDPADKRRKRVFGRKPEAPKDIAPKYTARHASPRKTARGWRAGKVVPAVAAAATLAAGTATAIVIFGHGGQPQPAELNAAIGLTGKTAGTTRGATPGTSTAAAASALVQVASGTASMTKSPSPAAKPTASKPSATPSATASPTTSPTPSTTPTVNAKTLSCNPNYAELPANVTAIVSFLLANGYSDNAAAGIAGNIYQESKGDPESIGTGGGGLIGWTPLPSGFVTGDVAADLQFQLSQVLVYNQTWASYLPALNAASSPADAADIYVTDFERAGIPAAGTREQSATNVAAACGI